MGFWAEAIVARALSTINEGNALFIYFLSLMLMLRRGPCGDFPTKNGYGVLSVHSTHKAHTAR